MHTETDHTEDIERYLDQEMSPEEKQVFEQKMSENATLKNEFELQQGIRQSIENKSSSSEIDMLSSYRLMMEVEAERKQASEKKTKPLNSRWGWMIAAAAVIALLILFFLPAKSSLTDSEIEDEYGIVAFSSAKGEGQDQQNYLQLKSAFENEQYQQGIDLITDFRYTQSMPATYLNFLSGFFYMQMGQKQQAIAAFEAVIADGSSDNLFFDQAYQQLGITYVHFHDRESAREVFEQMLQHPRIREFQKEDIREILNAMKD